MNTTVTISCSNPLNNNGAVKTTETESLSEPSSVNETIVKSETSLKESWKKQDKIGILMKTEFALGLLYLLVGLIIGQEIGLLSVPFAVTGCSFLLVAYLQQFNNKCMNYTALILGIVSVGLIGLWIVIYTSYPHHYYYLVNESIDGIPRVYWRSYTGSINHYLSHHIAVSVMYWLFALPALYLPVASIKIFRIRKSEGYSNKWNAFSIISNMKGKWCIYLESLMGFGLMITSLVFLLYLDDYNMNDLKDHDIWNSHSMLYIVFVNGLMYHAIAYLQCHAERKKEGCIHGMVWGVVSCVITCLCYFYMNDLLYVHDYKLSRFFLYISLITWIITPLSLIVYVSKSSENQDSTPLLPIESAPVNKQKNNWNKWILPCVVGVIVIGIPIMMCHRINNKHCISIDLVIDSEYDELSNVSGKGWRSIIVNRLFDYEASELIISKDTCVERLVVGDHSLMNVSKVIILDNPHLTMLAIGEGSFYKTTSLSLDSIIIND